eukprot:scaffold55067_cov71-Phaeocystis_antarctica.AAC.2
MPLATRGDDKSGGAGRLRGVAVRLTLALALALTLTLTLTPNPNPNPDQARRATPVRAAVEAVRALRGTAHPCADSKHRSQGPPPRTRG